MPRYVLNANGRERPQVLANAHAFLDRLPESKSWQLVVEEFVPERTLQQNKTTFGLAYKRIMDAVGLSGDAEKKRLHHDMCGDYFGWTDGPLGHRRPVRTTTTNERGERDVLDRHEMGKFYEFIVRTASEYNIVIPDPNPFWKMDRAA